MQHSIESITKVITHIRKDLDSTDRKSLGDLQTITLAACTTNRAEKALVLQLTDYIQYLLNLQTTHDLMHNETQYQELMTTITSVDSLTKTMSINFNSFKSSTDAIIKLTEDESTLYRKRIAEALKIWSKNNENFEHPEMVKIAGILTGKIS